MSDLAKVLGAYGLPGLLVLALGYVLFNPEKAERIASWIYRLFATVSRAAERGYVATDVQATINQTCAEIEKMSPGAAPQKVKIEWIREDTPESFLRRGTMIVRLRYHANQDKNLVTATLAYLSTGLIPQGRQYLDRDLSASVDFTIARRVLLRDRRHSALSLLNAAHIEPAIATSPRLRDDCVDLQLIDDAGFLSRVLLHEIALLGEGLYPRPADASTQRALRELVRFVRTIVGKPRGVDVPLTLMNDRVRVGFVLVARSDAEHEFDPVRYVGAIRANFRNNCDTVYLCGEGHNVAQARSVMKRFIVTKDGVVDEHEYRARGVDGREYRAYCAVIRRQPHPRLQPHSSTG